MYEILWTDDTLSTGYRSEAEAIREALEHNDPRAEIIWSTERETLGTAEKLAEELELID